MQAAPHMASSPGSVVTGHGTAHGQQPRFGGLPVLTPSTSDCAIQANAVQAKHEFRRALDEGNDADLAVWARRWGEGLTAHALSSRFEY